MGVRFAALQSNRLASDRGDCLPGISLFRIRESDVVATIRDTQTAPTEPALAHELVDSKYDVPEPTQPVTVQLGFFDVTGKRDQRSRREPLTISALRRGGPATQQYSGLPRYPPTSPGCSSLTTSSTDGSRLTTIEATSTFWMENQDGAFFERSCADTDGWRTARAITIRLRPPAPMSRR